MLALPAFAIAQDIPGDMGGGEVDMPDSSLVAENDSLITEKADSLLPKPPGQKKAEPLKAPIDYMAKDSIRFNLIEKRIYLYGESEVIYQDKQLNAENIEMDMENNEIYASYREDSTGEQIGRPVFLDGEDQFDSDYMIYNFNTKRAYITNIYTQQSDGYLLADTAKKMENDVVFIKDAKYTTCDKRHPHYHIALTKAKVIPGDKIISGPAYLVVRDVPAPLAIPFGYFPNRKGRASGILIPTYGQSSQRGFYLRDGGYYFGMSDYWDMALRVGIFTLGTREFSSDLRYKKRYSFNGDMHFSYNKNVNSEPGFDDYSENSTYRIGWNHKQDAKARPGTNFSASVDMSSANYNQENTYSAESRLTNQKQSTINYSRSFKLFDHGFNFSTSLRHSQNSRDSTISLNLPEATLNASRFQPLKEIDLWGIKKYDLAKNSSIGFSSNFSNKITNMKEDSLFTPHMQDMMDYAGKYSLPFSSSLKLGKYANLSPGFNWNQRIYFNRVEINNYEYYDSGLDSTIKYYEEDTVKGMYYPYDYSASLGLSSKLYGKFLFDKGPVPAIRHVLTPSVTYSYRPDFSRNIYGFYDEYQDPVTGEYKEYSYYKNGMYGTPGKNVSQIMSFSLGNNLEMKVKDDTDTIEGMQKVKLFESLNFGTSYNFEADSLNWSAITIAGRTNFLDNFIDFSFDGRLDPYALDTIHSTAENYSAFTVNKFEWNENGRLGRLTNFNLSAGINLPYKKKGGKNEEEDLGGRIMGQVNESDYEPWNFSWNVSLDYSLRYTKPELKEGEITETIDFSVRISPTTRWSFNMRSGYDRTNRQWSYTSINMERDLHCWVMSFTWVPFGRFQSYEFLINVRASMLQDLQMKRERRWFDQQ